MNKLDAALSKVKKKKEMKEGALTVVGKAAMAVAKGAGKVAKSGSKVVNPKVMGGEVKKSAQIAKNVKPKSGTTIDVKATEVGGDIAKSKKSTMTAKSSTPSVKYPKKSKGGEITNKGKSKVDPQKNPEAEKPKEDEPKKDVPKSKKKGKNRIKDGIEAIDKAYGTTSFSVKEQKTFKEWLEQLPVEQLDETLSGEMPKVDLGK